MEEPEMDRVVLDVVAPPLHALTKEKLFKADGSIDIALLKSHLQKEGRLERDAAIELIDRCSAIFRAENNVVQIKYPVTVCGDVHGQFFDLMRLLEVGGNPEDTQYLFLGDYVDRGCFSTEVVFFLYALKITYPNTMFMLRGNHECRQLTSFFNFKDECLYKYDESMYDAIMDSFDNLPLAAVVNKVFFCVHGGLSPDIKKIEEVKQIDRHTEVPREGKMCDLLWSDPYDEEGDNASEEGTTWYGHNDTRQCSWVYGIEAVKQFLKANKMTSIIRAHEAQVDGYKMHMKNRSNGNIPRVITVFSAPNYCDVFKNKAACLKFDHGKLNIKQFVDSPHPYYLPNFMDVFEWSLPFVAEKVTDMLEKTITFNEDDEEDEEVEENNQEEHKKKKELFKKKVHAVSKMLKMYKMLRQNNEAIMTLKQLTPNNKLPFGLLSQGEEGIKQAVLTFESAKNADQINEQYPSAPTSEK